MKIRESDLLKDSNNFDFIRILAAILVLIGHSPILFKNQNFSFDPLLKIFGYPAHLLGLFIFFIISGFLITKSWETKKNTFEFIISRIVRIFPALLFTIVCTTFILGPLFTTHSLVEYFQSEITYKQLLNLTLFRVYYELPGVFEFNPYNYAVNGSIWSLAYEFTCYLLILFWGYGQLFKSKWIGLSVFIVTVVLLTMFKNDFVKNTPIIPLLGLNTDRMIEFLIVFFTGSIFYQFRKIIFFNWIGYLLITILVIAARMYQLPLIFNTIIIAYLTFGIVFSKKIKLNRIGKYGDFSYGFYLFAFPIQQMIAYLFPKDTNLLILVIISILLTFVAAIISWNFIEKPSLKLKNRILKLGIQPK